MAYLLAAGAAASGVLSLLGSKESGKLAVKQSELALQRLGKLRDQQALQSAQDARNTSAALFNIQVNAEAQASTVKLQSAASDTIGASVSDALSTIDIIADRQDSQERFNYSLAEEERFRSFTNEADATGQEVRATLQGAINSQRSALLGLAVNAAGSAASSAAGDIGKGYANNRLAGQGFTTALTNAFGSYLR